MKEPDVTRVSELLTAGYHFIAGPDGLPPARMPALIEKCASVEAVRAMPANRACFVALSGDAIVGFLTIHGNEIGDLFVDTRRHRMGIGRRLFEHAQAAVRRAGHGTLVLVTTGYGIPFYEAMGMKVTSRVDITSGPLQGGKTTRLEMALK